MAYKSVSDIIKDIRANLKKKYPTKDGWKFSVRKIHHSSISVDVLTSPLDLLKGVERVPSTANDGNPYISTIAFSGGMTGGKGSVHYKELEKIEAIVNKDNFDTGDYGHRTPNFYLDLGVGNYEKGFVVTKAKAKAGKKSYSSYKKVRDFKKGDTVTADITNGNKATVTRVEKDVPRIGTMVFIEWKDDKKGLMQWSGKPENFTLYNKYITVDNSEKIYGCENGFEIYVNKEHKTIFAPVPKGIQIPTDEFKKMVRNEVLKTTDMKWFYLSRLRSFMTTYETSWSSSSPDFKIICDLYLKFYGSTNTSSTPKPSTSSSDTSWYIDKIDKDDEDIRVHTYSTYNKERIQKDFDEAVWELKEGEELHYCKDTEKTVGEYLLSVVKKDGELKQEIVKGTKIVFKKYFPKYPAKPKEPSKQSKLVDEIVEVLKSVGKQTIKNDDIPFNHPVISFNNPLTTSEPMVYNVNGVSVIELNLHYINNEQIHKVQLKLKIEDGVLSFNVLAPNVAIHHILKSFNSNSNKIPIYKESTFRYGKDPKSESDLEFNSLYNTLLNFRDVVEMRMNDSFLPISQTRYSPSLKGSFVNGRSVYKAAEEIVTNIIKSNNPSFKLDWDDWSIDADYGNYFTLGLSLWFGKPVLAKGDSEEKSVASISPNISNGVADSFVESCKKRIELQHELVSKGLGVIVLTSFTDAILLKESFGEKNNIPSSSYNKEVSEAGYSEAYVGDIKGLKEKVVALTGSVGHSINGSTIFIYDLKDTYHIYSNTLGNANNSLKYSSLLAKTTNITPSIIKEVYDDYAKTKTVTNTSSTINKEEELDEAISSLKILRDLGSVTDKKELDEAISSLELLKSLGSFVEEKTVSKPKLIDILEDIDSYNNLVINNVDRNINEATIEIDVDSTQFAFDGVLRGIYKDIISEHPSIPRTFVVKSEDVNTDDYDFWKSFEGNKQSQKNTPSSDRMSDEEIRAVYDSLEKGDTVHVEFDSPISGFTQWELDVKKGKTKVGKSRVERITLSSGSSKVSAKYYLYNRSKISFAVGDMATVLLKIEKV